MKLRDKLLAPRYVAGKLRVKDGLSSGSTMLNLSLTGKPGVGYYKGKYYHWVGDSDSGKTFLTMMAFAEASINKRFDDYQFIHDNPEDGACMDIEKFYGRRAARRLRPPAGTVESPVMSRTVEDFYYNIDDAMNRGPCIYVLDSLDALTSAPESKKWREQKAAAQKPKKGGKEKVAGTFGTGKPKANVAGMREVFNRLKETRSILFIVSQSKFSMSMFEEKTFSGGTALKFFCHAQLWLSVAGNLTTKHEGKLRQTGINSLIRVKKNRIVGRKTPVKVPIYWSSGVDDTGSCLNYLLEEGHWKKSKGGITAKELIGDQRMRYDDLIQYIESENKEPELRSVVEDVWEQVRAACEVKRKNRYGDE